MIAHHPKTWGGGEFSGTYISVVESKSMFVPVGVREPAHKKNGGSMRMPSETRAFRKFPMFTVTLDQANYWSLTLNTSMLPGETKKRSKKQRVTGEAPTAKKRP